MDENSDATFVPTFSTKNYFNLDTQYRRRFNDGTLRVDLGLGYDQGKPQADDLRQGQFVYDDTWRYGFDINRATSSVYLRDYRFTNHGDMLTSNAYVEGFGTGAYTRLDASAYQGLVASIKQARLPYVLPRYNYSFVGEPDALGGRFSFEHAGLQRDPAGRHQHAAAGDVDPVRPAVRRGAGRAIQPDAAGRRGGV